ncbi:hypothetical protein M378DRAFT_159237 [Amanita muscaria Koide BX008]|uniref:Uncharacterized protein n=1 Tax=Amanita muscaria (strain Koide BX008) TaxID=946122 RepID=A0A0C2TLJ2_AMAMK|nr:hypothetical protein M378DRAFT_159237 [Amanita muscaria Koide BX008]
MGSVGNSKVSDAGCPDDSVDSQAGGGKEERGKGDYFLNTLGTKVRDITGLSLNPV